MLLEKQRHSALEEIESVKLIIKLLQKESDEVFPQDDGTREAINSPRDTNAIMQLNRLENNKRTVTTAKCRDKGFSSKNLTEANNTYPLTTANCYEQLINLQDMLADDTTLKTQVENNTLDILNCDHQIKLQHQSRGRI